MSYLERNAQLITEIGINLRLRKGIEVGGSDKGTAFYTAGTYNSSIAGNEIFVGLKVMRPTQRAGLRLVRDLSFIRAVADNMPELAPDLPLFYGLLSGMQNNPLAILTEDFSEGGKKKVHFPYENQLPHELSRLFGRPVHKEELRHPCFDVDGRRRLGDFDTILVDVGMTETARSFPVEDIYNMRDRFILKIDYDL